jgi:hypothetical protein
VAAAHEIPEEEDECPEIKAGCDFEKQNVQERQRILLALVV